MATKEEIFEVYKFFRNVMVPTKGYSKEYLERVTHDDACMLTIGWAVTQDRRSSSNGQRPEPIPMPSGGAPIKKGS